LVEPGSALGMRAVTPLAWACRRGGTPPVMIRLPFAVCRSPFAGAGARSTVPLPACCSCRAHPPQGGLSLSLDVPLASQRPGNKVRPAGWGRTAPRPSHAMSLWRASALATRCVPQAGDAPPPPVPLTRCPSGEPAPWQRKTKKATSLSQPHRRAPGACCPGVAPFAGSPRVTEHAHAASSHCRSLNARGAPLVWR